MIKKMGAVLLCFTCCFGTSQNLIPNGGFEDLNICIAYQEGCFPSAWKSTSLKLATYHGSNQKVRTKNKRSISLLYLDLARNFDRRFIQSYLLCPIETGKHYSISFDYRSKLPRAKSVGFFFSDTLIFDKSNFKLENLDAQEVALKNDHPNEWQTYTLDFVAKKNAEVLVIGNFNSDDKTDQFTLSKKEQKKLDNSYEPKNRIWIELDNLKLISRSEILNCDQMSKKKYIYSDKVRHSFEFETPITPIFSSTVQREIVYDEKQSVKPVEEVNATPITTLKLKVGLNRLEGMEFEFGTTDLTTSAHQKLDVIVQYLIKNEKTKLKIIGHTDDVGNEIDNHMLSESRANEIRKYLITNGIAATRLSSKGMGESDPIASNRTPEGRQINRRVEVEIYY